MWRRREAEQERDKTCFPARLKSLDSKRSLHPQRLSVKKDHFVPLGT